VEQVDFTAPGADGQGVSRRREFGARGVAAANPALASQPLRQPPRVVLAQVEIEGKY